MPDESRAQTSAAFTRRDLILILEVRQSGQLVDWTPGALSLRWRVGDPDEISSEANRRVQYTSPKLVKALYEPTLRMHRMISETFEVDPESRWVVGAVELVQVTDECRTLLKRDASNAIAVVHGTLEAASAQAFLRAHDKVLSLNPLLETDASRFVTHVLTPSIQLGGDSRQVAVSITFVTTPSGLAPLEGYKTWTEWTVADQWLWHVDRGARIMPERIALPDFRHQQVMMNAMLRAVVTFQGLAIVGINPDPDATRGYYQGTTFQVRTLYTDVFILGKLQRLLLRELPGEISRALEQTKADDQSLSSIRHTLLRIRETYWSIDFGHRGMMDTFLSRFQAAYDMVKALTTVFADLDDHLAEAQVLTSQQTNALLTLLAVIGLPFSVATAAWASWASAASTWDNQRWAWLPVFLLAATGIGLVLSRWTPVRQSLGALLSRPSRVR